MTHTVLHFVFTASGAGCLVQALRKAGRNDQVIISCDDLSFGPINPSDYASRSKWVENELGQTDRDEMAKPSERDWYEALFPDNRKVAWLTRRSATEYAGFLDWLWRYGDAPCDIVDLTEVEISYPPPADGMPRSPRLAMSLGMLHHDTIRNNKLWDLAEPLQATARRGYFDRWEQLRSENSPLRIIDGGQLVSAPITFFDSLLMSYVTVEWQRVSRVVGTAMVSSMEIIQTGDTFLAARINALAKKGRLELRGESALEMRSSEVRLPRARG